MAGSFQNRLGTAPEEGIKAPCVVASAANITLSGEQTVNGYAVTAGDRVLVAAQTDASENGIYDASTGAWTRATDWNADNDVVKGILVVDSDNLSIYRVSYTGTFALDTTDVTIELAAFESAAEAAQTAAEAAQTAAATSESNASTSASNAATSESNAAASWDSFDDRYLGAKASNPTLDNDGDALQDGAIYWNTASLEFRAYDFGTTSWNALTASTGDVVGPESPTDDNLTAFDGTTGKLVKDSGIPLSTVLVDGDINSTVQAHDSDTAKLDADQSWTGSQRAQTLTDNDGSFDMNAAQDFNWTPAAADTLEFTNETIGQRGMIRLVNTSGYTITLGAEVKAPAGAATALTVAGTYLISYWCYDGTNVAITISGAIS